MSHTIREEKLFRDGQEKSVYFPFASPEDKKFLGKRNKIGGSPDWLQPAESPHCQLCGKEMTFYAQIDSVNDENSIEDGGMIYVFYCFECGEVYALAQSY